MSSDWVVRPVVNTVYKIVEEMIRSKSIDGDASITYNELRFRIVDRYRGISEEEIRKALLTLEIWGKIKVENNGNDLEIRLRI